jgi:hypothetical protein
MKVDMGKVYVLEVPPNPIASMPIIDLQVEKMVILLLY